MGWRAAAVALEGVGRHAETVGSEPAERCVESAGGCAGPVAFEHAEWGGEAVGLGWMAFDQAEWQGEAGGLDRAEGCAGRSGRSAGPVGDERAGRRGCRGACEE